MAIHVDKFLILKCQVMQPSSFVHCTNYVHDWPTTQLFYGITLGKKHIV